MTPKIESRQRSRVNADLFTLCGTYHDGLPISRIDAILKVTALMKRNQRFIVGAKGVLTSVSLSAASCLCRGTRWMSQGATKSWRTLAKTHLFSTTYKLDNLIQSAVYYWWREQRMYSVNVLIIEGYELKVAEGTPSIKLNENGKGFKFFSSEWTTGARPGSHIRSSVSSSATMTI